MSMPLSEFQKLSGLSDSALVSLLRENRIRCHIDEKRGIMVEASERDGELLIGAMLESERRAFAENESIIVERLTGIVADELERMCLSVIERLQGRR